LAVFARPDHPQNITYAVICARHLPAQIIHKTSLTR
jgi:hypothetical protein